MAFYPKPFNKKQINLKLLLKKNFLRLELSRFGVTVHIIEPGAFRTTLLDEKAFDQRVDSVN